ncbi:MAG: hypothetical protein ACXVB0_07320 [Mucilaginibacter sp.]
MSIPLHYKRKKYIFSAIMVNPNSKSYYVAAIVIGLAVGLATRDMPVGILLAVVLMIVFSGLKKKGQ